MNKIILLLITILVTSNGYAQDQHKIDSLNTALQKHEAWKKSLGSNSTPMIDTTKADILDILGREYVDFDPKKILAYGNECLNLSQKIGYQKGIGNGYHRIGSYYHDIKDWAKAKEYYTKALNIRLEIHDNEGISSSYNNLGNIYGDMGNSQESLKSFLLAARYAQDGGFKETEAATLHNIGLIYDEIGNTNAALENYLKAKKINTAMGNKRYLLNNLRSIGEIHRNQKNFQQALSDNVEALAIAKEIGSTTGEIVSIYSVIARLYTALKDYSASLKYYELMRSIAVEEKNNDWLMQIYIEIGRIYQQQGNLKEALVYLQKSLAPVSKANEKTLRRMSYQELSVIYKKMKNYKVAWEYSDKYEAIKDTTNYVARAKSNVAKLTQVLSQTTFDKQQDSTKAEQSKRDAVQSITRNALLVGLGLVLLLALILYNRFRIKKNANIALEEKNQIISSEKEKSENLLLNILPAEVAEELKEKGSAKAKHFDNVTVLFTDFKSFTTVSEQLSPQELVDELHTCFKSFDEVITKYNIEKIKTIGDAYLAVCGLPLADEKHAENVVNAALEIREFMEKRRENLGAKTFEIRIGINSGSVVAGIVGVKKFAYDIWGDTVNTAARMEQNSEAGKINISQSTYELIHDKFSCEYRGEIDAKNKGMLKMYFVEISNHSTE